MNKSIITTMRGLVNEAKNLIASDGDIIVEGKWTIGEQICDDNDIVVAITIRTSDDQVYDFNGSGQTIGEAVVRLSESIGIVQQPNPQSLISDWVNLKSQTYVN